MADPTIFEYQTQDDQGTISRSSMYMAYNGAVETIDAMIGAWLAYGALVDAVIDPAIVKGRITIPLVPDAGWKQTPAAGNNNNQVMTLNFENDFNSYLTPLLLPGYKEAVLDADGRPDLADAALAALVTEMLDGSGASYFPNSRDLHDLNALREAFLTTRKVRRNRTLTRQIP